MTSNGGLSWVVSKAYKVTKKPKGHKDYEEPAPIGKPWHWTAYKDTSPTERITGWAATEDDAINQAKQHGPYADCLGDCGENGMYCCDGGQALAGRFTQQISGEPHVLGVWYADMDSDHVVHVLTAGVDDDLESRLFDVFVRCSDAMGQPGMARLYVDSINEPHATPKGIKLYASRIFDPHAEDAR